MGFLDTIRKEQKTPSSQQLKPAEPLTEPVRGSRPVDTQSPTITRPHAAPIAAPPSSSPPKTDAEKLQPGDGLGIYAFIETLRSKSKDLKSDEIASEANRFLAEDPRVDAFIRKHGGNLIRMIQDAQSAISRNERPDPDLLLALHVQDLLLFIGDCESKARAYDDIGAAIKQPGAHESESLPPQAVKASGLVNKPDAEKKGSRAGSAILRFITSHTTLSVAGIAAFGAALHFIGGFQELSYGIDKTLRSSGLPMLGLPVDFLERSYLTVTSLILLTTELIRSKSTRDTTAQYKRVVKELPATLRGAYKDVCVRFSSIAREHVQGKEQLGALRAMLEDESFFYKVDVLHHHSYGEALFEAIAGSGLNPNVLAFDAISVAEAKIMKPKIEKLARLINQNEQRQALFKQMYSEDAVFRRKADEFLAVDSERRFLNYKRFADICRQTRLVADPKSFIKMLKGDMISMISNPIKVD